ncbi:protein shortage in chiasmata 1 ortholog isoform X2 [Brienomyrus brachyistius]|uniref:protein shortage in chiasmata 1 ortholog isoform X2 n=1 Tax=Brienomyrus brachyistius TaxID=42636 RepID=UPI0020B2B774|nr:protein shortage in chiasmata 1 ortholog isoform X2 [Brienomyrus brachyistius]
MQPEVSSEFVTRSLSAQIKSSQFQRRIVHGGKRIGRFGGALRRNLDDQKHKPLSFPPTQASARCKMTMSLLALPLPERTRELPDLAFREPWTRAKVMSSCRLSVGGSVLDDLCTSREVVDIPEKISFSSTRGGVARLTSQTGVNHPSWCETFSIGAIEQQLIRQHENLCLEEVFCVDFLPKFQKLPSLDILLTRLKTLTVSDPLLTLMAVSEPCILRDCVPWEDTVAAGANTGKANVKEQFLTESLADKEGLLLDVVLEFHVQSPARLSLYSTLKNITSVVPEIVLESSTSLEYLRMDTAASVQMRVELYDMPSELTSRDLAVESPVLSSPPVCLILLPNLELDVPLRPPCPPCLPQPRTSCLQLQKETLSPEDCLDLLHDGGRAAMEGIWKAEKHHHSVLDLLLAEPQKCHRAKHYPPLLEAAKLMDIKRFIEVHRDLEIEHLILNFHPDLGVEKTPPVEQIHTDSALAPVEDFSVLSVRQVDYILTESSDESEYIKQPKKGVEDLDKDLDDMTDSAKVSLTVRPKSLNILNIPRAHRTESSPVGGSERRNTTQLARACGTGTPNRNAAWTPRKDLDPLHTFMILRSQQWHKSVNQERPTEPAPRQKLEPNQKPVCTISGRDRAGAKDICNATAAKDRGSSHVIAVQASESQRQAYQELRAVTMSCLSNSNSYALGSQTDFHSLSSDQTLFLLRQQEKELSTCLMQGEPSEKGITIHKELSLVHVLVTARDLLLTCDLSAAVDYLDEARTADVGGCLNSLWTRLRVVQYLSWRSREPNPKAAQLEQEMKAWWLRNRSQTPSPKVLVILAMDTDCVRAEVYDTLSHITGVPPSFLYPEEGNRKLDGQRVSKSLQESWCTVVSSSHIGPSFPWDCLSLVVEYNSSESSAWATVCREMGISHMTFQTIIPIVDPTQADCAVELKIAFVLLGAGSLCRSKELLQILQSTYGMSLLERSLQPSPQMLGGQDGHSVVTVDESTAIFTQELEALRIDEITENVVQRLTALSLQYSHCWVLLLCPEKLSSGYNCTSEVFRNLPQIYLQLSWFGEKMKDMDVKVLFVTGMADLARCMHDIARHTLMTCSRDPITWLDRDWLSVLPSQEEKWLTHFPSISPLVAQLMLSRAPGFHWLLTAPLPDLRRLLPEVPEKVIKLFSEAAAFFPAIMCQSPDPPSRFFLSPGDLGREDELLSPLCPADFGAYDASSSLSVKDEAVALELGLGRGSGAATDLDGRFLTSRDSCMAQEPKESRMKYTARLQQISWPFTDPHPHGLSVEDPFRMAAETAHNSLLPKYSQELFLPCPTGPQWRASTSLGNTTNDITVHWKGCFNRGVEGKRNAERMEKEDVTEVIPHAAKRKLTYERIPGRGDGQTRLMFS